MLVAIAVMFLGTAIMPVAIITGMFLHRVSHGTSFLALALLHGGGSHEPFIIILPECSIGNTLVFVACVVLCQATALVLGKDIAIALDLHAMRRAYASLRRNFRAKIPFSPFLAFGRPL